MDNSFILSFTLSIHALPRIHSLLLTISDLFFHSTVVHSSSSPCFHLFTTLPSLSMVRHAVIHVCIHSRLLPSHTHIHISTHTRTHTHTPSPSHELTPSVLLFRFYTMNKVSSNTSHYSTTVLLTSWNGEKYKRQGYMNTENDRKIFPLTFLSFFFFYVNVHGYETIYARVRNKQHYISS